MKKFNFRYVSPVMTARPITQDEKDRAAKRRRYTPPGWSTGTLRSLAR
ncbi:hypothetical protein [Burkholderia vietnamiensis]|nr:hypothetical protein [Burkholderia vietnamiensis]MCA8266441.1 hypothetical protein [Burkholderia vietnamiensis]